MKMMKTAQVNGVTLAYNEFGTGDRYLLVSQNDFIEEHYTRRLSQPPYNYHVFQILMRGYGESTHIFDDTPRDYTRIWSEDVIEFARVMGIPRFYYTGHSHGNYPGWYILLNRPELLLGFASMDGIIQFFVPHTGGRPEKGQGFEFADMIKNRDLIEKKLNVPGDPTNDPKRLQLRESIRAQKREMWYGRQPEELQIWNSNFAVTDSQTEEELFERLSRVQVPVMIFTGGNDRLATPEECLKVAKAIPGCKFMMYQNMGHGGIHEAPEFAAADIDRFFRASEASV